MLSSAQLKKIVTEARPLIERQLDLAEQIAGLRDVVSAAGGDWSQLKALIKAQIQDERDEDADGKRVKKILDRADYATTYADMLGLSAFAKMNEENFFAEDIPEHDADGVIIESTAARKDVPHEAGDASGESLTEGAHPVRDTGAGTQAPPVDTTIEPEAAMLPQTVAATMPLVHASAEQAPVESSATHSEADGSRTSDPLRSDAATRKDAEASASEPTNVTPFRTHNPSTHFLNSKGLPRLHGCSNPEACAGSHRALCGSCAKAAEGSAA